MSDVADLDRMQRPRRAVGRPRRLTLRQIVDAGVALGLENLSLNEVALRLGVSVGTIYTYVANRDELVRLIAATMTRRDPIEDRGQHWADMVREFADQTVSVLRDAPLLLAHIASGAIEPSEELPDMERFVAFLVTRGFAADEALGVYQACGQIAVGAAVRAAMTRSLEQRGKRRAVYVRQVLEEQPDAYPQLTRLKAALSDSRGYVDHRPTLERLLAQVAVERGESLPSAAEGPAPSGTGMGEDA